MNAEIKPDPFANLLAKRTEPAKLVLPNGVEVEVEIREAPIKDVRFLLAAAETMDPQELSFRMLGASVYIGGQQLTFERVEEMPPENVKSLIAVLPQVFKVFGLEYHVGGEEPAAEEPEKKDSGESSTPEPEAYSNSPSS